MAAAALVSIASPSSASAAHCDDFNSPDKVELNGDTTSVNLPPGTTVCYKAGNQVFTAVVGPDGVLTSEATNKHGVPQGISYYIVDSTPPYPS